MSIGKFIKGGRAYDVTEAFSKTAATNVIYNSSGYFTEVNQWGTGTSFYQFPDTEMCQITGVNGKTLYIKDENDVWCPGCFPMKSDVNNFNCEHGDGYSIISSEKNDVRVKWRTFVPHVGQFEVWSVTIENKTDKTKEVSIVPAVKLFMRGYKGIRFADNPNQSQVTEFNDTINGLYMTGGNPWEMGKDYDAFLITNGNICGYCGDEAEMLGGFDELSFPYRLLNCENIGKFNAYSGVPFMAIQCTVKVLPGASVTVDFAIGIAGKINDVQTVSTLIKTNECAQMLYETAVKEIEMRHDSVLVETPDEKINYFMNTWLKKGMEYCLHKKDATRDNLQFAYGLISSAPEFVRDTLILAMKHQYKDGHTVRSWLPMDETYYSDGQMWLILVATDYIKFTDDVNFLNCEIPYLDGGSGTVLDHLKQAIILMDENRGPHRLPLARFADWNDALNLKDDKAESVFMAMAFAWCLNEMHDLAIYINDTEYSKVCRENHAELKRIINECCWDADGGYYVRGFSDGKIIGGSKSKGSVIYVNPQSWAILGDVPDAEQIKSMMDAVEKYIETDLGCLVNYPAYDKYDEEIGRISFQVPGTGENGAVYCHATGFKINADTKIGEGDIALRDLKKIIPDSEKNPSSRSYALPYTLTSYYKTHVGMWGRTGRPWLTGTQGWVFRCVLEGLLGIKKAYGGFVIEPAFPSCWDGAKCTIRRNGTEYSFEIIKYDGEIIKITENGIEKTDNFIKFSDEKYVEIKIYCQEVK